MYLQMLLCWREHGREHCQVHCATIQLRQPVAPEMIPTLRLLKHADVRIILKQAELTSVCEVETLRTDINELVTQLGKPRLTANKAIENIHKILQALERLQTSFEQYRLEDLLLP